MRPLVVTLWFVSSADPLAVLNAEPGHDRGFGRKYLALLDPRITLTPIGDFPLNRSAHAGPHEFYIGGFDGLAVVQTVLDDVAKISDLPQRYLRGIAATDVFVTAEDPVSGFGAFAHWRAGVLKRAFSATPYKIVEDEGLPDPVEGDFWAGRRTPQDEAYLQSPEFDIDRGVRLPFAPIDMAQAVISSWLGFDPTAQAPDIPVSAFAVDGRKVKDIPPPPPRRARVNAVTPQQPDDVTDYDDYEVHDLVDDRNAPEIVTRGFSRLGRDTARLGVNAIHGVKTLSAKAWGLLQRRNRR